VGHLPPSFSNEYILVAIHYVSKWVEAIVAQKAYTKIVVKFLKKKYYASLVLQECLSMIWDLISVILSCKNV